MSLTLSSNELRDLEQAIRVLVSPLDHPSLDGWRSSVNRTIASLLHADSAGFLLPVGEGLALYSDEHNPAELARYPDVPPPPTHLGISMWEAMIRERVMTNAGWFGEHYHLYLNSPYYNEYAGANGAHDTLAAAVSLGGLEARSMAALHFWHENPKGRLFGDREIGLLRLLHPAFCAGVRSVTQWRRQGQRLSAVFDWLTEPAVIADSRGGVLHITSALDSLLADDPEGQVARDALCAAVRELAATAGTAMLEQVSGATSRVLSTGRARYRVIACRFGEQAVGGQGFIIAALQSLCPRIVSDGELRDRFGLTPAEIRVAKRLANGHSSKEIAQQLGITLHTVRRHTEKVFMKLGVRSRAEAAARLHA
jgi:DNA-binding CsgD family transcriptional regulator